jgi:hypothetical protein
VRRIHVRASQRFYLSKPCRRLVTRRHDAAPSRVVRINLMLRKLQFSVANILQ